MSQLQPISTLTSKELASLCDHTFLLPTESFAQAEHPVSERRKVFSGFLSAILAKKLHPYAVCVRGEDVAPTRRLLPDTIAVVSVAGFPDGSWVSTAQKVWETSLALEQGAAEIDMVMNYRAWKSGDKEEALQDVKEVLRAARTQGGLLKVILEVSEWNVEQLAEACQALDVLGVDFIKTSTGFSNAGASEEALRTMRASFSRGIKASGSVSLQNVQRLLEAAAGHSQISVAPLQYRIGSSKLLQQLEEETQL